MVARTSMRLQVVSDMAGPDAVARSMLLAELPKMIESLTLLDESTKSATSDDETCSIEMASHQTALKWAKSPGEAYQLAKADEKLVFLIHVSGNFEIPGFT